MDLSFSARNYPCREWRVIAARLWRGKVARRSRRKRAKRLIDGAGGSTDTWLTTQSSNQMLSPNQIAKILNLTGEAVKHWIYRRRLPATKLPNGYWKVSKSDFEAFLKAKLSLRKTAFLVCSDATNISLIKDKMALFEFTVIETSIGSDALLKADETLPQAIIVDADIPGSIEWISKIRCFKKLSKVYILIIISRPLSDVETNMVMECGVNGCLIKPISERTLEDELMRIQSRQLR
jgi:hypothetical protein